MSGELVKVCGTTSTSDIMVAARWNADAVGIICEPPCKEGTDQTVTVDQAQELTRIARGFKLKPVLLPHTADLLEVLEMTKVVQPDRVQLGQSEDVGVTGILQGIHRELEIAQVIHVADDTQPEVVDIFSGYADIIHLDTAGESAGGTGETHDWDRSREIAARAIAHGMRVVLAGGLTPQNVLEAIDVVDPGGVDVQTGIKTDGENDPGLINFFVSNARFAFRSRRRDPKHPRHDRNDYATV